MESNAQTELTSKMETDSQSRLTALGEVWGARGKDQTKKKENSWTGTTV